MKLRGSDRTQNSPDRTPGTRSGADTDSTIGSGLTVDGNCTTDGTLHVSGRVTGNVHARALTVGPDGHVEGDVSGPGGGPVEGGVVVEGRVKGGVRSTRAEVGKDGSVGGGLDVDEAVVRGRVDGGITADQRLMLEESAVVEGDITARRLGVREGGRVSGTIRIGDPKQAKPSKEVRESRAMEAGGSKDADTAQAGSPPEGAAMPDEART